MSEEEKAALRDMFAAAALTGLLSADGEMDYQAAASHAYEHADYMLLEREGYEK